MVVLRTIVKYLSGNTLSKDRPWETFFQNGRLDSGPGGLPSQPVMVVRQFLGLGQQMLRFKVVVLRILLGHNNPACFFIESGDNEAPAALV
jgi:hypothetical protein